MATHTKMHELVIVVRETDPKHMRGRFARQIAYRRRAGAHSLCANDVTMVEDNDIYCEHMLLIYWAL